MARQARTGHFLRIVALSTAMCFLSSNAQSPVGGFGTATCQNSAVTAALAALSQRIAQNAQNVANCYPPDGPPSCTSSQLATLNEIGTQLNNEYQAELQNCRPVQGPAQPTVGLNGIEVVQAIQDMNQSVPLVAGKTTWARVYLSTVSPTPITVTGTLQIVNNNFQTTTVQAVGPATLTAGTTLLQMRNSLAASLNFIIPPSFTAFGADTLTLATVTNASGGASVSCSNCSNTQSVLFLSAAPLWLRIVPFQYTDSIGSVITPRPIDFALLNSWLTRAYPISQLISSVNPPLAPPLPLSSFFTGTLGCIATDAQLAVLRVLEIAFTGIDPRTHYYGMVLTDPGDTATPNGGFMRGCSGVPSYTGSGPTGIAGGSFVGDSTISFGDWYGGHEIGHTFGRGHPSTPAVPPAVSVGYCGAAAGDPLYPWPNAQISDNQGDLVGLDVGDPTNGIPAQALAGASHYDMMTYPTSTCVQPLWISDYTFEGVLGNIQVNATGAAPGSQPPLIHGHFVSVVAIVDISARTGKIDFAQTVDITMPPEFVTPDHASLRFVNEKGKAIANYVVNLSRSSDPDPEEHTIGLMDAVVPQPENATKLELYFDGKLLDGRKIGRKAPVVHDFRLAEPGTLTWDAKGEPGFSLTYVVMGTPDGKRWDTLAMNLTKPELRLSTERARLYQTFRIVANDGFNNSLPVDARLNASRP